jgi:Fic family protein
MLEGKTWYIPDCAEKPHRHSRSLKTLLDFLQEEQRLHLSGGLYHRLQIDLTYNSNHIEGSQLSHEQTRYIFETRTLINTQTALSVNDIIETINHFRCVDLIIEEARAPLTERFIKKLHFMLKYNSSDAQSGWFKIGDYKHYPNEVGGQETTPPAEVSGQMKALLKAYQKNKHPTFEDLLDFHVAFERIHPFQDGNGRVGRLLLLKECLKHNIVPFIITEKLKYFYYRGLQHWPTEKEYLLDTCLTAQDNFRTLLARHPCHP